MNTNRVIGRVKSFIRLYNLLSKDDKILVGVSGGVDSMVLLEVLHRLEYSVEVAHMNYQMREDASEADEELVRNFCDWQDIPFHLKREDGQGMGEEGGVSFQEAAREARYTFFYQILSDRQLSSIATAHHRDDNLETVLLNLFKGTGLQGLSGIPVRNDIIVRPLLCLGKDEIIDFAEQEGIPWREDQSNARLDYDRNKIRNQVLPLLESIHPGLRQSFNTSVSNIRDTRAALDSYHQYLLDHVVQWQYNMAVIDPTAFPTKEFYLTNIYALLSRFGFNRTQCLDILDAESGSTVESDYYLAIKDRKRIIIEPIDLEVPKAVGIAESDTQSFNAMLKLSISVLEQPNISADPNLECIPLSKISFPLEWRLWKAGDSFAPLGMNGLNQKVQDFYTNIKAGYPEKRMGTVLVNGDGEIIWVVGYRLSERFKVEGGEEGGYLSIAYQK